MGDNQPGKGFKHCIEALVSSIPKGRAMSYGQIAALCGRPGAARAVGQIAHFGISHIPWQRVVNMHGGLAKGYYFGREGHKKDLEAEGVIVSNDFSIDIQKYRWWPPEYAGTGHSRRNSQR